MKLQVAFCVALLFAVGHSADVDKDDAPSDVSDVSFKCGLCSIAVNEIEGMLMENATLEYLENKIKGDVCVFFEGAMKTACDDIIPQLPALISRVENKEPVGVVCVEEGFCEQPISPHADMVPPAPYVINLDLPPIQRWTQICSNTTYRAAVMRLIDALDEILGNEQDLVDKTGRMLNDYYFPKDLAQEIQGCAAAMNVSYGWLSLVNLGYELSDACTSIVAQTEDGKIYHARNLDFWDGVFLTEILREIGIEIDYQKGGKTLFRSTGMAGYVGVLSAHKPGAFSLTVDTRFYPQGISQLFYEVIAAIVEKNASLVTFLTRHVMENEFDYNAALNELSNDHLVADVYYILAGVSAGQGAVISRNRLNASDIWTLDTQAGRWFEVETNYDHWKEAPWFDNRVTPANNGMTAMGRTNLTLDGMLQVLSTKPVFNLQTVHTILSCPADSTYQSYLRWCPYPCTE